MTESRLTRLQRFIYSHHFVSGVRRGLGVMLGFALVAWFEGDSNAGLIAALGALCVAIIDQPGPFGHRIREMTGGLVISALAVSLTGLASSHPVLLLVSVVSQTFLFSMFAVFGKRGAVIGTGCLIVTVATMHTPLTPDQVLEHTLVTVAGALFYLCFSALISLPLTVREEEQTLSVALFATANYVAARGEMYDPGTDIDEAYRRLLATQSSMSEQHQAARDMILRRLSPDTLAGSPRRVMIWNVFVDMIGMLDLLVATHTDYTMLHRTLGQSDAIVFMRDALLKMSSEIERIAQAITQEKPLLRRNSVKAELRALEFEIEQMKRSGFQQQEPESYAICVQILRRLRNTNRLIEDMLVQTSLPSDAAPLNPQQLESSLAEFLSRQSFRPGLISSNLRLDSPTFRFSLRVSLGVALALSLGLIFPQLGPHGYWIVLTVIIIMKPAFSLTKQRNTARLTGTLIGCAIAFGLFYLTDDRQTLAAMMVGSIIVGFSFMLINYLIASIFTTVTLLIGLHFILPGSFELVSERALDTALGSLIAFVCSYFLPWWEANSLPSLARAAIRANQEYLRTGIKILDAGRDNPDQDRLIALNWPLARKNTMVAFSNFAEAFYRMMGEPPSHQQCVAEFNNLLIQNHIMAAKVSTLISQTMADPKVPEALTQAMKQLDRALEDRDLEVASGSLFDRSAEQDTAEWAYPLRELQRAIQSIIRESMAIRSSTAQ